MCFVSKKQCCLNSLSIPVLAIKDHAMMFSLVRYCVLVAVVANLCSQAFAETVQTVANVFNGRPFLWLEAENYASITDGGAAGNGWKVVSKQTPVNSNQGVP